MANYRDYIASRLPARPWKGRLGERFVGVVGGLFGDLMATGASLVVQALWLIAGQPADALSYQGSDKRLRRYLAESDDDYRARLERALEIWEIGGTADCIEGELDWAGYAGATVHSPRDWTRTPLDHITQFWVYLPLNSHLDGAPGEGALCGLGFVCGDPLLRCGDGVIFGAAPRCGTTGSIVGQVMCGIQGPVERVMELRHIARQFKAGHEVCRQIIVEVDAPICGTGLTADDGSRCGGSVGLIGTGVIES